MSDPFGNGSDAVGNDGSLEQSVDTGGVDIAQTAGGEVWGQGSSIDGVGTTGRGDLLDDDARDIAEDAGLERERFDSIADLQQTRRERERAADEAEAAEQAAYEEHLAEEAARDAAREEAHANGEAFLENEWTTNGETYQEWSLPDGTHITVDSDGNAVSVVYPEGEGPIYIGDVMINGEAHAVYLLPSGTQIVVDDEGNTVGTMDDVDVDDTAIPLYHLTGDKNDAGETVIVELVPNPDGSYDTIVRDAETGEPIDELNTGTTNVDGKALSNISDAEWDETYSMYAPPGADYYLIIDENGVPVDTIPIPEEPEWSFLGIVEYYEGGEVVVDIGVAEVSVDVVGPDGGITVDLDLLIAEATAGVEWNEDGSWAFDSSIEFDAGGANIMGALGFGQDADGMAFIDIETAMEMQMGIFKLEGGQNFNYQQTPDGFEVGFGWEGSIEAFGAFVGREDQVTLVKDGDEYTGTVENTLEAGIRGVGSVSITNETQIVTDLILGGTSASQGLYGAVNDGQGNEVAGGGFGVDTQDGFYGSDERVDTKDDYERVYGDDDMPGQLGDDAASQGQADADRFGLGSQQSEDEDADGDGAGRSRDGLDGPLGERVWGGQEGEEFDGRRTGDTGPRDVFDDVAGARSRPGRDDGPEFGSDRPRRGDVDDDQRRPDELIDTPDTSEAQFASEPPAEGDERELPKIWKNRDGDATDPDDEEPVEPRPEPKPEGERPKLFERDPKPGDTPDDGPKPDGPTVKPEIFTERLMDTDEDGDGVPDGRDPMDPIGTDGTDLSDIVNGPPARQTASAGPDQSSGTVDRPDDDGLWIDLYAGGVTAGSTEVRKDSGEANVDGLFNMDAGTVEVRKDSGEAHVDGLFSMDAGSTEVRKDSGEAHVDGLMTTDGTTLEYVGETEKNVDGLLGTMYGGDVADQSTPDFGTTVGGDPNIGKVRPDRGDARPAEDAGDPAGDPLADDIVTVPSDTDDAGEAIPEVTATAHAVPERDTIVLTGERPVEADGGAMSADVTPPEPPPAPEPVVVVPDPDPVVVPDPASPAPEPVAEVETAIPAADDGMVDGLDDQL